MLLMSIQRKSSRCSRKDFTGPPSGESSGRSGLCAAMPGNSGRQALGGRVDGETGTSAREGAGGAGGVVLAVVSADAFWISSVTSRVAFLNSLMPVPSPFANSGIFLAPNKSRIAITTITISQPPKPINANMALINFYRTLENLRPLRGIVKPQKERPRERGLCVSDLCFKLRAWDAGARNSHGGFASH